MGHLHPSVQQIKCDLLVYYKNYKNNNHILLKKKQKRETQELNLPHYKKTKQNLGGLDAHNLL